MSSRDAGDLFRCRTRCGDLNRLTRQSRDRREKFEEYEKAGVREYWIIDPLSKTVELYRLERKRFYAVDEVVGVPASCVLRGFRLKPSLLWRKPLPKVSTVLRQIAAK